MSKISILDDDICGLSTKDKVKSNKFLANLTGKQGFLTCDTTSICWLLNIRGQDTQYTPLLHSYFIYNKRLSFLFCDIAKLDDSHKEYLKDLKVEIVSIDKISEFTSICKENKVKQIYLDPNYVSYFFYSELNKALIDIIKITDPIIAHKAIKNETEILGSKRAHILDGIAKTNFLYWIDNSKNQESLDELQIAKKLLNFRQENSEFLYPSFETISAFAENGAIIHYNATIESNKKLNQNSLLLVDSGGQYKFGTTDITRTIPIGDNIQSECKRNFTLVLKGHIALATAIFPKGTTGSQLDVLARQYLWSDFKDYEHGTGHGVGSFLNVHEGPQNIGKNVNNIALKAGMILSNEPGIYIKDKYGIRLENLILVKPESEDFLGFETISLVPFDEKLINFSLLSNKEIQWLKNYHQKIYDSISSSCTTEVNNWLLDKIKLYT